jgi:uncharacterized protein
MFIDIPTQSDARLEAIMSAAHAAIRAIPPAFPLSATVAVNPFLGQSGEDLATAKARLRRVAGVEVTPPRSSFRARIADGNVTDADLQAALAASSSLAKPNSLLALKAALGRESVHAAPLPTVAHLAADQSGIDWPALIAKAIGLWAAGHFDRGQALWLPKPGRGAFAAWREWAANDLTPEIAGISGFCAFVSAAPDSAERAILRAVGKLELDAAACATGFHRLLVDLGGWAQHARYLMHEAELSGGSDSTLLELLAVRLLWEEALLELSPEIAPLWRGIATAHLEPVLPSPDDVIDAILEDAAERAYQRRLFATLAGPASPAAARPALQAAFCIDVRSEVFRRALESLDSAIETIGFAGFFGLPLAHCDHGTDIPDNHLPVLLNPALSVTSHASSPTESAVRISARAVRAWGRFRQAAVSSLAFVEAAGLAYGAKLVPAALGIHSSRPAQTPAPHFAVPLSADSKAEIAASVLNAMGLTAGFARTVLFVGHGTAVTNNPHESAYQCGACGGHTGEVSARILAGLLNDSQTRAGLKARGIEVPADTHFLAGLHVTTTDEIQLFDDQSPQASAADTAAARSWLKAAGAITREERAARLPYAGPRSVAARAQNWAELRPEWGLAGCASFIAAPRTLTRGRDLGGRSFLHSYEYRTDQDFKTLELILTAPVVVASWISLQYYGSTVAQAAFGAGDKLLHNVIGGLGVVEGNGGTLRAGLPLQAVHDGRDFVHEPLRLSVLIEAPRDAVAEILARHPSVQALFDNGWLHLIILSAGEPAWRYRPGSIWESVTP